MIYQHREVRAVVAPDLGRELTADETLKLFDLPPPVICTYCGRGGHYSRDCRKLHREVARSVAEIELRAITARKKPVVVERKSRVIKRPDGSEIRAPREVIR